MTASIVAAFLFGMVAGVFVLLAATGMLLAVRDWREAVREGSPIEGELAEDMKQKLRTGHYGERLRKRWADIELRGEEFERNRKRGES